MDFEKLPLNFTPSYFSAYAEFRKLFLTRSFPFQISISTQNLRALALTIPEIFKENQTFPPNFYPK